MNQDLMLALSGLDMIFDLVKQPVNILLSGKFNHKLAKLTLVLFFLPTSAIADPKISTFVAEPTTCMTLTPDSHCQMQVDIQWQQNTEQDTCLLLGDKILKCWHSAQQGSFKQQITLSKTTELLLINKSTNQTLGKQTVAVRYVHPKNYRRRLRADWSIF